MRNRLVLPEDGTVVTIFRATMQKITTFLPI